MSVDSRSLAISRASSDQFATIEENLWDWHEMVVDAMGRNGINHVESSDHHRDLVQEASTLSTIVQSMIKALNEQSNPRTSLAHREVIVCRDEMQSLEGVMIITLEKSHEFFIQLICTHPKNLGIIDPNVVRKGVGAGFIEYLKRRGAEIGFKEIACYPERSSARFFDKMGFSGDVGTMKLILNVRGPDR